MKSKAPTPIIAGLFYFFAGLTLVAAVAGLFVPGIPSWEMRLAAFGSACFTALLLFGGGQLIHLLGRAAFFAETTAKETATHRELLTNIIHLQEKMIQQLDENIGDEFVNAEAAQKSRDKALVFLHNIDAAVEHTNKLLAWIGEERMGTPPVR